MRVALLHRGHGEHEASCTYSFVNFWRPLSPFVPCWWLFCVMRPMKIFLADGVIRFFMWLVYADGTLVIAADAMTPELHSKMIWPVPIMSCKWFGIIKLEMFTLGFVAEIRVFSGLIIFVLESLGKFVHEFRPAQEKHCAKITILFQHGLAQTRRTEETYCSWNSMFEMHIFCCMHFQCKSALQHFFLNVNSKKK